MNNLIDVHLNLQIRDNGDTKLNLSILVEAI
jgi:hypothetical protein